MNAENVKTAKAEALRFLAKVGEYEMLGYNPVYPCPARAAMIRASLDLTKALSRMRRGE